MSPHPTKRALVTGGSAGIGKETVRALAAQGYEVIVAARDASKGEAVLAAIQAEHPGAQLSFHALDLSQPDAVVAFAQQVQARWDRIDALVLNAGLFTPALRTGSTGHEFMFATTHLGHFMLTHQLLPLIEAAPAGRIVVTSSVAHFFGGGLDFDSLREPSPSTFLMAAPFRAYGRSKLANLLFVRELARRLQDSRVLVNSFHPGSVKTEIWRGTPSLFNALIAPGLISEREGAQTQIFLATSPALTQSGQHWFRKKVERGSRPSRDPELARQLWTYSEQALGIKRFGRPQGPVDVAQARRA